MGRRCGDGGGDLHKIGKWSTNLPNQKVTHLKIWELQVQKLGMVGESRGEGDMHGVKVAA